MLFSDPPARIESPGTHHFASSVAATYTAGRDHVVPMLRRILARSWRTHGRVVLGADIESFGLGMAGYRMKAVAFSDDRDAVVLDPRDPYQASIARYTIAHAHELIFYNSAYDVPVLYVNGLLALGDVAKITDPLPHARLALPSERGGKKLSNSVERYLGTPGGDELALAFKRLGLSSKEGYRTFDLDRPIYLQGAASDPLATYRLAPVVRRAAYDRLISGHPYRKHQLSEAEAWRLVDREQIVNRMMLVRGCKGFRADFEYLDRYRSQNAAEVAQAERELEAAGVRPGIGLDLSAALEREGAMPADHPRTDKTGQYRMTAQDLERLPHPLARQFLRHKKIEKIGKDYLQKVVDLTLPDGRVRPSVNILAAVTGRASMGDPPFHQFSGPARGIVQSDEHDEMTSIDLSQIEPVIGANVARDVDVLRGYEDGTNDLYTDLGIGSGMLPAGMTKAVCESDPVTKLIRGRLKVATLAQLYGEGLAKLSADLGLDPGPYTPLDEREAEWRGMAAGTVVPRYREARLLRERVFTAMPRTENLIGTLKQLARRHRLIQTVAGRIIPIPSGKYGVEAHKGVNYFIQGSAYDELAECLVRIHEAGLGDAIYLTMHDELIVSTSASRDIRKIMQEPSDRLCLLSGRDVVLRTDLKDLGTRWSEA